MYIKRCIRNMAISVPASAQRERIVSAQRSCADTDQRYRTLLLN
jgi:hypothetical protein